jgi:GNAT superfamily N-acetyltransferase
MAAPFRVEPFARQPGYRDFSCGVAALDGYLATTASQHIEKGIAAVMVALDAETGGIVGFYTLSGYALQSDGLPDHLAKRLPRSLPAFLLGKLAVATHAQGRGLGGALLTHALRRAATLSREIGAAGVVVDAIDEAAVAFYARFGFVLLTDQPRRLFLPMRVAAAIP